MKRVLIADDDSVTRGMLSRVLKSQASDVEIYTARNGEEAVQAVKRQALHLVVADLQLPNMNGLELVDYLKDSAPHTPILAITAFGTPEMKERIESIPAAQYIEKPLNMDVMTDMMIACLGNRKEEARPDVFIQSVGLSYTLQQIADAGHTYCVIVKSAGRIGRIFIENGVLTAARADTLEDEAAVRAILEWTRPTISLKQLTHPVSHTIRTPLPELLSVSAKRQPDTPGFLKGWKSNRSRSRQSTPSHAISSVSSDGAIPAQRTQASMTAFPAPTGSDPPVVKKEKKHKRANPTPEIKDRKERSGHSVATTTPVVGLLSKIEGIAAYRIYNDRDVLMDRYGKADIDDTIRTGLCWQHAQAITSGYHTGMLQYIVVNTRNRTKYVIAGYDRQKIVVSVKPGFKPDDLMRHVLQAIAPQCLQ